MQKIKDLKTRLNSDKTIRVMGFDDAPFAHQRGSSVNVSGVVCAHTRFEGMLWFEIEKDGLDATDQLIQNFRNSKFYAQVHALLLDGLAFGGFNLVDLPRLANECDRPCIAVMRKMPDLKSIERALENFSDAPLRKQLIAAAGEIYSYPPFYFQVQGCSAEVAFQVLQRCTDTGDVPEALRIAHFIGSAVMTGQSSKRA